MAIKVGGVDVVDNSLGLKNIATVDATTADAISAAGVGGGKADFVASGTIANGDVVTLNSDGTVTAAGLSPTTAATPALFNSGQGLDFSTTYDTTNNKVIVFYRDWGGTNDYFAQVGTVSGNSITFGTAATVRASASVSNTAVAYDATANKVLFFLGNRTTNSGEAYVGTISGNSISVGSVTSFENGVGDGPYRVRAVYDSGAGKVVIIWRGSSQTDDHKAAVCTVSGTTVTVNTPVTFANTIYSEPHNLTYDSTNGKIVIAFVNVTSGYVRTPQAIVGTVSGTSITFGTAVDVDTSTASTRQINLTYDSTNSKVIILYQDRSTNPDSIKSIVGTVSGTSISFGTASTMHYDDPTGLNVYVADGDIGSLQVAYDSVSQKVVAAYRVQNNATYAADQGYFNIGTVSGNSISWATQVNFETDSVSDLAIVYDPNQNKSFLPYYALPVFGSGSAYYTILTSGGATNLTDTNLIGVSTEAISDTATGTINIIGGINESQTGLTTGTTYYAANDGSLSTTNNGRKVGKAISSTKLLVDTAMSGPEMNTYLGGLV